MLNRVHCWSNVEFKKHWPIEIREKQASEVRKKMGRGGERTMRQSVSRSIIPHSSRDITTASKIPALAGLFSFSAVSPPNRSIMCRRKTVGSDPPKSYQKCSSEPGRRLQKRNPQFLGCGSVENKKAIWRGKKLWFSGTATAVSWTRAFPSFSLFHVPIQSPEAHLPAITVIP